MWPLGKVEQMFGHRRADVDWLKEAPRAEICIQKGDLSSVLEVSGHSSQVKYVTTHVSYAVERGTLSFGGWQKVDDSVYELVRKFFECRRWFFSGGRHIETRRGLRNSANV